jgi:anthraniloyl-CoA monooxygenase
VRQTFADEHGAGAVDVSTGQVVHDERPAFGRSYQTPFADQIRNEVGIATIAVGAISSYDDVNSILLAGRADLAGHHRGQRDLARPGWRAWARVHDHPRTGTAPPAPRLRGADEHTASSGGRQSC